MTREGEAVMIANSLAEIIRDGGELLRVGDVVLIRNNESKPRRYVIGEEDFAILENKQ